MSSNALALSCSLALVLAAGSLACSAQSTPGEVGPAVDPFVLADDGGRLATDGSAVDAGGGGGGGGAWEIPECAEPSGPRNQYASIADVEAKLGGAWFLCSGGINAPADAAGIAFSPGAARFLVRSGATVAPGAAPEHRRSVEILDTSSMNGPGAYQVNLSSGGWTNMYQTRTSQDGRFLELIEGTSGKTARYVRATKPAAPPGGEGSCDAPLGTPHAYTSIPDVQARLQGRWKVCTGGIHSPSDTRGLELAPTMAYFLVDTPAGLARKASWDYERDVTFIDATSMNGAGSYQINLKGVGTNMYFSRVSEDGTRLELDEGTSGRKVSLARVR